MKMSAWIRFCLIVLCLAMACSMFACGNGGEETTEAPVVETTEAPSVEQPTEEPTEKPTETTPIEVTTEAPVVTTEPTEVTTEPTEVTTEAPVVTTEPTEVTTEPTEESTEAPEETTEATTEVPEVETATDVTIGEDIVEVGDSGYIEEAVSPYYYNCDSHGGKVGGVFTTKIDPLTGVISGIKGWLVVEPGVMAYKYALVIDGVQQDVVDITREIRPGGSESDTVGYYRNDIYNHVAKNYTGFNPSIAGGDTAGFNFTHTLDYDVLKTLHGHSVEIKYFAVIYKVDAEGGRYVNEDEQYEEGAYVLLATFKDIMPEHYGVSDYVSNEDGTHSALCALCSAPYMTETCSPAKGTGATAVDTTKHTGMTCTLCGQTGIEGEHSAPTTTVWNPDEQCYETIRNAIVWNEELSMYQSICVACDGQVGEAFSSILNVEAEDAKIGQPSWASKQINFVDVDGTYCASITKMLYNGADGWSNTYLHINPEQIAVGRYMAIRYRVMLADGDRSLVIKTDTAGAYAGTIAAPLVNDGEWHIVVVDLASAGAYAPDANGNYIMSNASRLEFSAWTAGDILLIDWFRTYDRLEAIGLEQSACECPSWANELVSYDGTTGHTVKCNICGTLHSGAHTPDSTRGVKVDGAYVKTCAVCGGATAESAMGLYVFGKDELATLAPKGGDANKQVTENGVKFTNPASTDSFLTVFSGNSMKTGQYFFIKYRANGLTSPQFYMWNTSGGHDNAGNTPGIINDGEWHVAVVDVGNSTVAELRLDVEGSTPWIEIAYLGYADDVAALANALKTAEGDNTITYACGDGCQAAFNKTVIINETTHGIKCAICDTTLSTEAHVWASTDCATVMPACSCGAEKGVLGHTAAGSDGEYCSTCFNFLKVDDVSKYFAYFWGGKNAPNATSAAYKGQDAVTGYNVYTTTKTDYRHQLISTTETVAGRYLVVKYLLVDGTMNFGLFASTKQTGINGSYFYNHELVNNGTGDGWRYLIVDLVESIKSSGVAKAEDGSAYLQHLTVDYDLSSGSTATAQFAYVAVAATLEDAIAGIKAIDGVEKIDSTCCFCPSFCLEGTYVDEYKHVPVCKLCGKQGEATAHVGADHGVWNEELNDYYTETPCTACGEIYCYGATVKMTDAYMFGNARPWGHFECTWTGNSWKLKKLPATEYNWVQGHLYINPNDNVTGQYLLIKYIATGHPDYYDVPFAVGSIASQASSNTSLHFIFDNTPRYIILDLSTLPNYTPNADGTYSYEHNDDWRMDFVGLTKDAVIEFLDISMYDAMDRIPAIAQADCTHPTFALQGEEIDAETHGSICQICNKTLDTADHTYPITAAYDSELEYYVHACTVCGYTKRAVANVFMDADAILASATVNANLSKSEGDEGGAKFTQLNDKDANANFFQGWAGTVETGNYLFFKYRTSGDVTSFQIFTSTAVGAADGAYQHKPALDLSAGWHLAIIDLSKAQTFAAAEDSKYYARHLRFDVENGAGGDWMEIAYVGLANDLDALIESLQYFDADIDDICPCGEFLATIVSNGVETHSLTCKLCGTAGDPVAHTGAYGVWNETESKYLAVCGVCGDNTNIDYGCTVGGEAEDVFTNLNQWNLNRSVNSEDGYVRFTKNNGEVFCATYFKINPNEVATGRYLVLRYRVNTVDATDVYITYNSAGNIAGVPVNNDGEWHTAIVTLNTDLGNSDEVRFCFYLNGSSHGWVAGEYFDLDWVRMYDSTDRIPGYQQ